MLKLYPGSVTALVILLVTVIVATVVNRVFMRYLRRSAEKLSNDPLNYSFLRHTVIGVIYLVGISLAIYAIPPLRTLAKSGLAGAGILAVILGFASQAALSNVIAGMFIVMFKPYRVNDRLTIKDTMSGIVEDITLRHTIIRNFENRRIIIPNSIISNEILINSDLVEEKVCKWVEFRIHQDADLQQAKLILKEEALRHPLHIDNRSQEDIAEEKQEIIVRVTDIRDGLATVRAWVWAKNSADAFELGCDLFEAIKARFNAEGIQMAVPRIKVDHSPASTTSSSS